MRKFPLTLARTAAITVACVPVCTWAHPGHGDTVHYILGGAHGESGAHEFIANPLFAAALLIVSAGVLCAGAWRERARARSSKPPRPAVKD